MKKKIVLGILAISITALNTHAAPTKGWSVRGLVSRLTGGTNKALSKFEKSIDKPNVTITDIHEKLQDALKKATTINELKLIKKENDLLYEKSRGSNDWYSSGWDEVKYGYKHTIEHLADGSRGKRFTMSNNADQRRRIYSEIEDGIKGKREEILRKIRQRKTLDPSADVRKGHITETVEPTETKQPDPQEKTDKKPTLGDHIRARFGNKAAQEKIKKYKREEEERKQKEQEEHDNQPKHQDDPVEEEGR